MKYRHNVTSVVVPAYQNVLPSWEFNASVFWSKQRVIKKTKKNVQQASLFSGSVLKGLSEHSDWERFRNDPVMGDVQEIK